MQEVPGLFTHFAASTKTDKLITPTIDQTRSVFPKHPLQLHDEGRNASREVELQGGL